MFLATYCGPQLAVEAALPALGRFRGFSPVAPLVVNDYTMVETRLEVVFICVRETGTLTRLVI